VLRLRMAAAIGGSKVDVFVLFERARVRNEPPGDQAAGYMDTVRRWTRVHHAHTQLAVHGMPCELADAPFRLSLLDRVRIEVTRRIARTIARGRIADLDADRCVQVVEALARLGVAVELLYDRGPVWEPLIALDAIRGRGANCRALAAPAERSSHVRSVA